jgi:predicted site-specific integrase-resolvase
MYIPSRKAAQQLGCHPNTLRKWANGRYNKDIGSELNYKRRGLKAILERAMRGEQLVVVVAYKDRWCRFGFDLISWIIEQNAGKIVVLNQTRFSPERELITDLRTIIPVFSCRLHGLRSYKSQINQDLSEQRTKETI